MLCTTNSTKIIGDKMPKFLKRIPPEKRMKKYRDFGVTMKTPSLDKVKWTEFLILVPTDADKAEVQAAMEYLHNRRDLDTDFITVNQMVHQYEHGDESDKYGLVRVDAKEFKRLKKKLCKVS